MRSALRHAVVLFAVIACGCKEEDDDDDQMFYDSSVLPNYDAGIDAGRPDGGGPGGTLDATVQFDASQPRTDTGVGTMQDATTSADAAASDASMDAGSDASSEGGAGDAGSDAGRSDAGGDAGRDAGPSDAGGDAAADARVDAGPAATFSRVLTILKSNCGACHTTRREADLNFSEDAGTVYRNLVGVRGAEAGECGGDNPEHIRVLPDRPDDSLLIQKLVDPACGDRMPRFRDPLSPALIDEIRSWIADGAPEN